MMEKKKKTNGKRKGNGFERKAAQLLSEWWGEKFHRTPGSGGLNWQDDNRVSGDIVPPKDSLFPFNVECKKVEGWNFEQVLKGTGSVASWWEQCTRDADKFDSVPLLMFSKNNAPVYVALRIEDYNKLVDLSEGLASNFLITMIKDERVAISMFEGLTEIDKEEVIALFS